MDKMLTAGELLRQTRLENDYSLDEVSAATKIQKHYLKSLEKNEFDKFPSDVYTKGFIQNYSKFLKINPNKVLALYRRSQGENKPKDFTEGPQIKKQPKVVLTPTLILVIVVGIIVIATLGYLIYQFYNFQNPPELDVTQPPSNITVDTEKYTVKGITEPDMFVTINDEAVKVNPNGEFEAEITLSEGTNTLIIKSRHPDNIGQEAIITRNIEFDMNSDSEDAEAESTEDNAASDATSNDSRETPEDDTSNDETPGANSQNPDESGGPIEITVEIQGADAWIEIEADGEIVYSSVATAGSELEFTAENEMSMVTGLVSATNLFINGEEQELFINENGIATVLCEKDDSRETICRQP
jgi:cytoskeletal protein RodZ